MPPRRRTIASEEANQEKKSCFSTPTVYHAAIVIFLEFFAFGLLTTPMISVLDETFPKHTFLMNGIIQGVKGFLSFLSAPLLGALSDGIGRKPFLFLTVTFTCFPLPLMKISPWWYFTMISISGVFAVTFSVVLAYVADITTPEDRSWGYGLVSATFAASLVSSPAIGAYLGRVYSEELVIALATAIAFLDIFFILACVPESLPEKVRASHLCSITNRSVSISSVGSGSSGSGKLSWDKIDPFAALRKVSNDYLVLIVCITTFFSYLPEAGQYSCFFVYLRLVLGFSEESVASYIAVVGILSCITQTIVLSMFNSCMGAKRAIQIGLIMEAIQLTVYGFATHPVLLWTGGVVASLGSITYPALSAFVSTHAAADQQGVAQGLVAGIRGLCGGLGPAIFGLIFYIFRVDLNNHPSESSTVTDAISNLPIPLVQPIHEQLLPGAPFAFGAILVLLAIVVSWFIPEDPQTTIVAGVPSSTNPSEPGLGSMRRVDGYEGNRLRRFSPTSLEMGENSADVEDDSLYDSGKALLLDSKHHCKQIRTVDKDHVYVSAEPGLWDRLLSSWSDRNHNRRRAAYPLPNANATLNSGGSMIASRRSNRMFRQPTVPFTRAHFVEPIRRLFTGFTTTPPHRFASPSRQDAALHNTRGFVNPCESSLFDQNDVSSSGIHGSTNDLFGRDTRQTRCDTEAADLSNYRSHQLHQFFPNTVAVGAPASPTTDAAVTTLSGLSSPETDRVMAHRFDRSATVACLSPTMTGTPISIGGVSDANSLDYPQSRLDAQIGLVSADTMITRGIGLGSF